MSNKTSGFKRAIGIVLGVITMLVLIALFVVLVMAPIPNIWVDKVAASDNAIDQTVSPTQSETYCPAPIGLADTGTYGDSAFQATVGNLSTGFHRGIVGQNRCSEDQSGSSSDQYPYAAGRSWHRHRRHHRIMGR